MLLNCGVGEDSWESLGLQGDPASPSWRRSVLGGHWKDWCWSWNSNTLATWCEELTCLKRPWCWERSRAGGEGDDRGWDGWMVPLTRWTWVWVDSGSWWWTGRPGMLRFMGSQRVRHDWVIKLNLGKSERKIFRNVKSYLLIIELQCIIKETFRIHQPISWLGKCFTVCISLKCFFFFFFNLWHQICYWHILYPPETSLVNWLRFILPMQGLWVWSLVGEQRFHTIEAKWSRLVRSYSLQPQGP